MFKKLEKNYVSEVDKLLQDFDAKQEQKTASQLAEIAKHQRIAALRDDVTENSAQINISDASKAIWKDF